MSTGGDDCVERRTTSYVGPLVRRITSEGPYSKFRRVRHG